MINCITHFIKKKVYAYIHQDTAMKIKLILVFSLQYLNTVHEIHPLPIDFNVKFKCI